MKLKKIVAAVLSLSLVCGAVPFSNVYMNDSAVFAEEEYTEGTYGVLTYKNYGDYIEISDCDSSATEVEIPCEIDGVAVTTIAGSAFSECVSLTDISIPESVIDIGGLAFIDTPWFNQMDTPFVIVNGILIWAEPTEGVVVPDDVWCIGTWAFIHNDTTNSVILPNSVTKIEDGAFLLSHALTSITIPESVDIIGEAAFHECGKLKDVTILNPECEIRVSYQSPTFSNYFGDNDWVYNGTIYGYENSTAQAYAEKYGYKFESLGEYVETILGDTDGDGVINSSDASNVLAAYALIATGGQSPFTEEQTKAADVNKDGAVDSSDASSILAYYAYTATGGEGTLEDFLS